MKLKVQLNLLDQHKIVLSKLHFFFAIEFTQNTFKCKFWCLINFYTIRLENFLKVYVCVLSHFWHFIVCMRERRWGWERQADKERKWASSHHGTYVKVRGQLTGVLSFYHGVLGLNTGYQACWQVPSPIEPSDWPKNALIALPFKQSYSQCLGGTDNHWSAVGAIHLLQNSYFCLKKLF